MAQPPPAQVLSLICPQPFRLKMDLKYLLWVED